MYGKVRHPSILDKHERVGVHHYYIQREADNIDGNGISVVGTGVGPKRR
jgi:hypothetical protein